MARDLPLPEFSRSNARGRRSKCGTARRCSCTETSQMLLLKTSTIYLLDGLVADFEPRNCRTVRAGLDVRDHRIDLLDDVSRLSSNHTESHTRFDQLKPDWHLHKSRSVQCDQMPVLHSDCQVDRADQ